MVRLFELNSLVLQYNSTKTKASELELQLAIQQSLRYMSRCCSILDAGKMKRSRTKAQRTILESIGSSRRHRHHKLLELHLNHTI